MVRLENVPATVESSHEPPATCARLKDCPKSAARRDSVKRGLLEEMNALANELSDFAALMLETSSEVAEESTTQQEEVSGEDGAPPNESNEAPEPDRDASNCEGTPLLRTQKVLVSGEQPLPASADIPYRAPTSQARATNLPPPAHSRYQRLLRAYPPKPKPNTSFRKSKRSDRAAAKHQLTSKVREILSSPTLWKEYQSKSFQQHILRQQQARHLVELELVAAENATAAHFKRAQCGLKLKGRGRTPPDEQLGGRVSTVSDASYLRQFWRTQTRRPDNKSVREASDRAVVAAEKEEAVDDLAPAENGVLCGVYIYGNRRLGLSYFTCSTLAQLEERVCRHFRIDAITNIYKERVLPCSRKRLASSKTKSFQRITMFEQVRDGDRLCVTQDSYEDMAILCEWIKQRQLRVYNIHPQQQQHTNIGTLTTAKAQAVGQVGTSEECAAMIRSAVCNATPTATAPTIAESLWDANGRSVSIKKQLEL